MRTIILVLSLIGGIPGAGAQVLWKMEGSNKTSTCSHPTHTGEQVLGCLEVVAEGLEEVRKRARTGSMDGFEIGMPSGNVRINVRYTDHFLQAQQAAREDNVGLWAVDGFACEPASFRRGDCG